MLFRSPLDPVLARGGGRQRPPFFVRKHAEIAQRIKEGRWEIVGGMWVEPDLNMPDGESLVRQLLVGKRWFKQQYGVETRIGWNPDSFGYTWQLPQIYKKSGVDYFVTTKLSWNDTNPLPLSLFWWQSPDGSKVQIGRASCRERVYVLV